LTSTVILAAGQSIVVSGDCFNPGDLVLWWDALPLGTTVANDTGFFNVTIIVPVPSAGQHTITILDKSVGFRVFVKVMPSTTHDYDGLWRNSDFTINLTPDPSNAEIYYRVNAGPVLTVDADGQPRITAESASNAIEYWSVDAVGSEETPHKTLTGIKLDKTSPAGLIQINDGAVYTTSVVVTLSLVTTDSTSGVQQVRFSNDGVWDSEPWEAPGQSKSWTLTSIDGVKIVFLQIRDNAGLEATLSDSITLDATNPTANAGQSQVIKAGLPVTFDASNSTDNSGIASYVWSFGDGSSGVGKTVTHSYESPGAYTATLSVQDAAGNTSTSTVTVTVQHGVVPEFPAVFVLLLMGISTLLFAIVNKKRLVRLRKAT
jgi:hypothetical protein